MAKRGFFLLIVPALGFLLAACGEGPIPDRPGFETDIKPLTLSRCVRCHGAGGTLNADPKAVLSYAPFNGFFDQYDDPQNCTTPTGQPCRGFAYYAGMGRPNFDHYFPMMPPSPGAQLSDRERELINRWIAETPTPDR
jgi:hypothetical protein